MFIEPRGLIIALLRSAMWCKIRHNTDMALLRSAIIAGAHTINIALLRSEESCNRALSLSYVYLLKRAYLKVTTRQTHIG